MRPDPLAGVELCGQDICAVSYLIDWYEHPAQVTSSAHGTEFRNLSGDTFTITPTGVRTCVDGKTMECVWAQLRALSIKFPEYPRALAWYAALVRGVLSSRAECVLEFSPAFPGVTWIVDVTFGAPNMLWNLRSRQFFAALDEVLPVTSETIDPDLLSAYSKFCDHSYLARALRAETILRDILIPR